MVLKIYHSDKNFLKKKKKKKMIKRIHVPVVTLSAQDNTKLLQQLKTGFKRIINWNKYQVEAKFKTQNRYLNY